MQHTKITGIIVRTRPHSEFDRILTVFSAELGMVRIIAKGIRRARSHRSFHVDLLNLVIMEVEENEIRRGMRYLREISILESFASMKSQPEHFAGACTIAAFLLRILPDEAPTEALFDLTLETFRALNTSDQLKQHLLSYFLASMRLLGHMPNSLPQEDVRSLLAKTLQDIDPQFVLHARRTLGIFSSLESIRSS
ncbi:MAG: DNA repair protein RecO [Patescibacteria group bacterium]